MSERPGPQDKLAARLASKRKETAELAAIAHQNLLNRETETSDRPGKRPSTRAASLNVKVADHAAEAADNLETKYFQAHQDEYMRRAQADNRAFDDEQRRKVLLNAAEVVAPTEEVDELLADVSSQWSETAAELAASKHNDTIDRAEMAHRARQAIEAQVRPKSDYDISTPSIYRIPLADRPALIPKAEANLEAARVRLHQIETGEVVPTEGIQAGWEHAKTAVERAEEALDQLHSDQVDTSAPPKQEPSHQEVSDGSPSEKIRPAEHFRPDYEPHAQATLAKMLEDPTFARTVQSQRDFGRNRTPDGMSDIMAAYALPYMQRAAAAEAKGQQERAAAYRTAGEQASDYARRRMEFGNMVAAADAAGASVSVGTSGGLVEVRAPKRPIDMLKSRNLSTRLGLTWSAFFKR